MNDLGRYDRDPIDEIIELGGYPWRLWIPRVFAVASTWHGCGVHSSLRTQTALERSEVAVVLLDVSEPISERDVRIVQTVIDSGRAMVLAFNKWDTLDEDRRYMLEREIERDLAHVQWAPRVNISARPAGTRTSWCPPWSTRWSRGIRVFDRSPERVPGRDCCRASAPAAWW